MASGNDSSIYPALGARAPARGKGGKGDARRERVRRNRPDAAPAWRRTLRQDQTWRALAVLGAFAVVVGGIIMLRPEALPYRLGQTLRHDVVSRVPFTFVSADKLQAARVAARENTPRVYARRGDTWGELEAYLLNLPERVRDRRLGDLDSPLRRALADNATLLQLQQFAPLSPDEPDPRWREQVAAFVGRLRQRDVATLPADQWAQDRDRRIRLEGVDAVMLARDAFPVSPDAAGDAGGGGNEALARRLMDVSQQVFGATLYPAVAQIARDQLGVTHEFDPLATAAAQNNAAAAVAAEKGQTAFVANVPVVTAGDLDERELALLQAENEAFRRQLGPFTVLGERAGLAGLVVLLCGVLATYVGQYQPRIVANTTRAVGLASLFAGTTALALLAAHSTQPIYLWGTAPTVLVAMTLAIAYDRRFALGAGAIHAAFVSLAANAGLGMLIVLVCGVVVTAVLLDEVRTRRKLIEVGAAAGGAMAAATAAVGLAGLDAWPNVLTNALFAFGSGLGTGVVVLGVLPFVEKAFRISTGMTLLELADVNHPLLRRLQNEAPGSYNHSMQVAVLAEEAARAIGANALLCRVAGYYHDVGKVHKSDYFIENQSGGHNRHMNLSPSVSLLIIIGHVKDGVELAREYDLPREVIPFIQEHHGTTLVEFFYRTARDQQAAVPEEQRSGEVPESQYRYPGPKPRSKETAIMMIADTCESATRAMKEHNPARIEDRVDDLVLKRLHDGQFDECDLTLRELELIKRSLVKSLLHIYHGRIEYPSDKAIEDAAPIGRPVAAAG